MKKEKIGFWMLEIIGILLVVSAFFKILASPDAVTMFSALNLSNYLLIIGIVELIVALLIIVPKTQEIGIYTAFGYFGGAMVAHLTVNDLTGLILPIVFFIITLIGFLLQDVKV